MRPLFKAIAIAIALGTTGLVFAAADGGTNPVARGDRDPFHTGPLYGTPRSGGITSPDLGGIGRPNPRSHAAQVTPVPEPSQWAMMLAGLALVGVIVRRNRQK